MSLFAKSIAAVNNYQPGQIPTVVRKWFRFRHLQEKMSADDGRMPYGSLV